MGQKNMESIAYNAAKAIYKQAAGYTDEERKEAYITLKDMIERGIASAKPEAKQTPAYEVYENLLGRPEWLQSLAESTLMIPALLKRDYNTVREELKNYVDYIQVTQTAVDTARQIKGKVLAGVKKRLPEGKSEKEIDRIKWWVGILMQVAMDDPETADTPEAQQLIENLWEIIDGLDTEIDPDKLRRFIKKQEEFIAVHRPAGFMDLLAINGIKTTEPAIRELGRVQFTYDGKYGETEKKIQRLIDIWLAENNYSGAKKDLNTYAILPLADTMRMLGMAVTPDNLRKFKSRLMSKKGGILQNIKRGHIDIDDRRGTGLHAEVGTGSYAVSVPKDQITFQVSDAYAMYQNAAPLGMYSSRTLYLKGPAFLIADKLQDQYFRYGNRTQGTNNILSVKKLLEFLSDTLPSYEAVQQTNRGHWIDRIREPIEEALNQIQQEAGLFKWQYCKKGMQDATPQEIATKDYRKWASLYITYQLIPKEPYTPEQIENRQKRIEAAQEKKALKDAQALIKADNIRKRQRKRKEKEAVKQAAAETSEESENG